MTDEVSRLNPKIKLFHIKHQRLNQDESYRNERLTKKCPFSTALEFNDMTFSLFIFRSFKQQKSKENL